MVEFAFALLLFLLAFAAMAIGVMRGRRAIIGSCGGLNRVPGVASDCGGACRAACSNRRRPRRDPTAGVD